VSYRAEYLWIDGSEPTREVRSKTKVLADGDEPGIWGFDGSSTNQATGDKSDVVLRPVFSCPDPIRKGNDVLVLCETLLAADMSPHPTNTRHTAVAMLEKFKDQEPWFGMEQEYTLLDRKGWPAGFPPGGFPGPQGPYYCGVGALKIHGRELIEAHTTACMEAGLSISGTNAEVMPGQWEFQIGPLDTVAVGDQLWVARYLLFRLAEGHDVEVSIDPKPMKGDWNGAGMHTNFSTKAMREGPYELITAACEAMGAEGKPEEHIAGYGWGIEDRLTGAHETQHFSQFSYAVSDRGASIRIPWQVEKEGKGYIEDRRPNANADPYVLTTLITNTVCSALG
jgi:glutamine synthetase